MLGHKWLIKGTVVSGDKRGREIGFPTANLEVNDFLQINFGVYAVKVEIDGMSYNGIANYGIRPTFDGEKLLLETYLFDFSKDIYGKDIVVSFIEFIRKEKKFDGIDLLKEQIALDSKKAIKILVNKCQIKKNTKDYRDTLLLPKTDLPMKAKLSENEPILLENWDKIDTYASIRKSSQGKEKFILHDGPPYANGNVHMGTALNKILKDVIVKSKQMAGFDAIYRPGWDCHGLPIEWKIEEQYREQGKSKEEVPINEFRSECRLFAKKWIKVQKEEFKRLGVFGDWENPYTTMEFESEAIIVREFHKFLMNDDLYCGSKPVMWSVIEKTALAEAEVEYKEHVSPTIWVKFPLTSKEKPYDESSILNLDNYSMDNSCK